MSIRTWQWADRRMNVRRSAPLLAGMLICLTNTSPVFGQSKATRDSSFDNGVTAGESDAEQRSRALFKRPQFDLGFMTLGIGGGLLFDVVAYSPDSVSEAEFGLHPNGGLRDARFLLGGRFKSDRRITWQAGIMYDKTTKTWLFRQTGVMVAVPEIWSHFFIGRSKEGFSLNKVMNGYDGWSMERLPFTDATIPLLADGVKWLGTTESRHLFWNIGWFGDAISEGQTFSSYDNQFIVRAGWQPLVGDTSGTVLHFALNLRRGKVNEGQLQLRSRPESYLSPYFVDTDKFPARSSEHIGYEAYYRPGSLLIGTEMYWMHVNSPETGNPWFRGGEAVISWLPTGEIRGYNSVGNYFRGVSPLRTVIQGGPGAFETLVKISYTDLRGGTLDGGVFWRVTPMINWHLTDNTRLEFAYGYGKLDQLAVRSTTYFFQSRLQLQL